MKFVYQLRGRDGASLGKSHTEQNNAEETVCRGKNVGCMLREGEEERMSR